VIRVRNVAEVLEAERQQLAALPEGTLMQRAAFGLSVVVSSLLSTSRGAVTGSRVVLLVGSGNNGGDALWAGARLAARGCRVDAVTLSSRWHEGGADALVRAGGRLHAWTPYRDAVADIVDAADVAIDGILGIGGSGALRPEAAELLETVRSSGAILVAVDVPSGVDADTGAVEGAAVEADVTVTFGAMKPGLLVSPGVLHCGSTTIVDIGLQFPAPSECIVMEGLDVARWVPEPAQETFKYRRGVVGVAAGSGQYPGAALLAVSAARGSNVGMTRFLDRADGVAPVVVGQFPDVVVDGSDPSDQTRVDAWACGSGFPGDSMDAMTVRAVLATSVPVVLDAGALHVVADAEDVRAMIETRHDRGLVTVITPHEGEFDRIFPTMREQCDGRIAAALDAARTLRAIVVLKGPGTIVAAPDGACVVDTEGTADLGTAGSGDVLTGTIGAVLAGAWSAGLRDADLLHHAVGAAVWLHGAAGRIAGRHAPVVATDVSAAIGAAVREARFGPDADRDEGP
jgi:hydroxyethylthiazole kinase-like uncharacterized protein yjeF